MTQPTILSLLGAVNEKLAATPEGRDIFDRLKRGEIDMENAAVALHDIAARSGLIPDLTSLSKRFSEISPGMLKGGRPVAVKLTGLPQLNPLVEAAIMERASLDGDVPEMRTGQLPPEGRPAVPVIADVMEPATLGSMLETASEHISRKLVAARAGHTETCGRLIELARETAARNGVDQVTAMMIASQNFPPVPTGVPGYEAGQAPTALRIAEPNPLAIAALPETQKRALSFKVLSTTQGRKSAAFCIEQDLTRRSGVPEGKPSEISPAVIWQAEAHGAEDLGDSNSMAQAAAAFLRLLRQASREDPSTVFSVSPWADIPSRKFGWVMEYGPPAK